MADHQDAAFIEYVVKQLVENPEGVSIDRTVDEMGVLIQLTVDPKDMGRVIGKEGRTAKALRTLLRVMGAKNNARVNLKIMEPDGGEAHVGEDDEAPRGRKAAAEEAEEQPMAEVEPVEEKEEEVKKDEQPEEEQATEVI